MRAVLFGAIGVGLLAGVVVAAVRVLDGGGGGGPAGPGKENPTPTVVVDSPEDVAGRWARAWSSNDIEALFSLVEPASQQAYPLDLLRDLYSTFALETTRTGLQVNVTSANASGASLAVQLDTRYFGTLEYDITLSFVETNGVPRVRWFHTTLHPALVDGRRIVSEVQKPSRGAIYDRNGQPLAVTRDIRMLGLNRAIVSDRESLTLMAISLGFTRDQVNRAFDSPFGLNQRVPIGTVPDDEAEAATIAATATDGLLVYFETGRVHPLGAAAAHIVGYTRELTADELTARAGLGYSIGDRIGAVGIEAGMDETLGGQPGGELRLLNSAGDTLEVLAAREFVEGQDVHTTLDSATLVESHRRLGGRAGASVVIDPRTNELLALNSSPSYDPDAFERQDQAAVNAILDTPGDPLNNRATVGLYSAGSTFKLVTGAAAFSVLGVPLGTTYPCTATWNVIDPPLRNWEGAQGDLTIAQALMRSCNPVFWQIAYDIHTRAEDGALSEVARAFGFGARSGVVGFYEEPGFVPDPEWKARVRGEAWLAGDDINLAIGQGELLVTPLQLANAYVSIISGELRTPVVLLGETPDSRGQLPLTPEQRSHLRRGLELVASPTGTAASAFAGYSNFAGKSGTAEDADQQQHVLFVAYAPSGNPRAVAAVILDDGDSGSREAGPIARDMVLAAPD